MKNPRWVGFDMDECLGALYPLYSYCEDLLKDIEDTETAKLFFMDLIEIISEESFLKKHPTIWLFRPEFAEVLKLLIQAYQEGRIAGCFILSNNGSERLVYTARLLLNSGAAKLSNYKVTDLFKASWHAYANCRRNSLTKSWSVIQTCLQSANLPRMQNPKTDLIFFDDKVHTSLKHDLGNNYIQVTPYFNYTPHTNIARLLDPLFEKYHLPRSLKLKTKQISENIQEEDLQLRFTDTPSHSEEGYSLKNPSPKIKQQIHEFIGPIQRFIQSSPKTKTKKSPIQKTIRNQKSVRSNNTIKNSSKRGNIWKRY